MRLLIFIIWIFYNLNIDMKIEDIFIVKWENIYYCLMKDIKAV